MGSAPAISWTNRGMHPWLDLCEHDSLRWALDPVGEILPLVSDLRAGGITGQVTMQDRV